MLIEDYKKHFDKKTYKMERPFIGKRADVCNKLAAIHYYNG